MAEDSVQQPAEHDQWEAEPDAVDEPDRGVEDLGRVEEHRVRDRQGEDHQDPADAEPLQVVAQRGGVAAERIGRRMAERMDEQDQRDDRQRARDRGDDRDPARVFLDEVFDELLEARTLLVPLLLRGWGHAEQSRRPDQRSSLRTSGDGGIPSGPPRECPPPSGRRESGARLTQRLPLSSLRSARRLRG